MLEESFIWWWIGNVTSTPSSMPPPVTALVVNPKVSINTATFDRNCISRCCLVSTFQKYHLWYLLLFKQWQGSFVFVTVRLCAMPLLDLTVFKHWLLYAHRHLQWCLDVARRRRVFEKKRNPPWRSVPDPRSNRLINRSIGQQIDRSIEVNLRRWMQDLIAIFMKFWNNAFCNSEQKTSSQMFVMFRRNNSVSFCFTLIFWLGDSSLGADPSNWLLVFFLSQLHVRPWIDEQNCRKLTTLQKKLTIGMISIKYQNSFFRTCNTVT